jgi:hypothetical protein
VRPLDDGRDGVQHRVVGLVEQAREQLGVAVHPEHELGQVVGADGDPGDAQRRVVGDPVDDGRHLSHHPAGDAGPLAERAGVDQAQHPLQLGRGAHERQHERQVAVAPVDRRQRFQLQGEHVRLVQVTGAPAPPDHGVGLLGLQGGTAAQGGELVRAEVGRPVDDRARFERGHDAVQRPGQGRHELRTASFLQDPAGVLAAQGVGQQQLGPQQPDAVHVQRGGPFAFLGEPDVHTDPCRHRCVRRTGSACTPRLNRPAPVG